MSNGNFDLVDVVLKEQNPSRDGEFLNESASYTPQAVESRMNKIYKRADKMLAETLGIVLNSVSKSVGLEESVRKDNLSEDTLRDFVNEFIDPVIKFSGVSGYSKMSDPDSKFRVVSMPVYETVLYSEAEASELDGFSLEAALEEVVSDYDLTEEELEECVDKAIDIVENFQSFNVMPSLFDLSDLVLEFAEYNNGVSVSEVVSEDMENFNQELIALNESGNIQQDDISSIRLIEYQTLKNGIKYNVCEDCQEDLLENIDISTGIKARKALGLTALSTVTAGIFKEAVDSGVSIKEAAKLAIKIPQAHLREHGSVDDVANAIESEIEIWQSLL